MFLQIYSKTIKKLCLFYIMNYLKWFLVWFFYKVNFKEFCFIVSLGIDYIIYTVDYSLPYISVACKIILL